MSSKSSSASAVSVLRALAQAGPALPRHEGGSGHEGPGYEGRSGLEDAARAVVDSEGRIAFASPEFCRIFGFSLADLSGQSFDRLFRIGWPDLEAFDSANSAGAAGEAVAGVRALFRRDALPDASGLGDASGISAAEGISGPAARQALFDLTWMTGADGRRYLVISAAESVEESAKKSGKESGKIGVRSEPESLRAPSPGVISPDVLPSPALAARAGSSEEAALLERTRRQLSEAESIGHMGHWRWAVGTQGVEWSDGMYRIFGLSRDGFTPTLDSVNALLHRRDAGRLVQVFQRAIIEKNDYDLDFRVMRPDGEARHVRCEGRCEKDAEGEVIALFGIMQDVTDRMTHEKQLRDALNAAERAYAAKSQFLATMSHELRTPLNAIIGFSEIMQKQILGPIGTPRYLEYIEGIRQSGAHLLDLIGDILDMSRIEAGKYTLDIEPLALASVLDLCVRMMAGKAQEAGVSLTLEPLAQEEMSIRADRRALTQIVLNLLSNAVKFTPRGGKVVLCAEAAEKGFVVIRVADTGCGIPAHKLRTVTRPFEQAHDNLYERKQEGSGLGLAITRELAELHGGSLRIDSEVGVGTRVSVRLPVCAARKRT